MCEKAVGDPQGELAALGKLADDTVVLGEILPAAACIAHAGDTEAVHLPHEVSGGIQLVVEGELRCAADGRVEEEGVRFRDQQAGRFSARVARDEAAGRVRCAAVHAQGAHRGAIEHGRIVEVQHHDRRVGRCFVQFLQRGHPFLGELPFVPAADDADPVGRRRALRLLLQHPQRVGQRGHAVPAQLEVVVKTGSDDVQVRVVEAGDDPAPEQVDDPGVRAALTLLGVVHADDATVLDREACRLGLFGVERGDAPVVQDQIDVAVGVHGCATCIGGCGAAAGEGGRCQPGLLQESPSIDPGFRHGRGSITDFIRKWFTLGGALPA